MLRRLRVHLFAIINNISYTCTLTAQYMKVEVLLRHILHILHLHFMSESLCLDFFHNAVNNEASDLFILPPCVFMLMQMLHFALWLQLNNIFCLNKHTCLYLVTVI